MIKKICIVLLLLLKFGNGFAQTDHNGNPVFNSVMINEKAIDDYLLIASYYTLKHNIENTLSSVFIAKEPSLDQVEKAALTLPAEHFLITKESKMVVMILLQNFPERQFMTIEMNNNKDALHECNLVGDITENRALEIIAEKYDPNAQIINGTLKFNGKEFKIISNESINKAIYALIKKEKLNQKPVSNIILPSQKEIKLYILEASKVGGDLDFFTEIKNKEFESVQIKPGVFSTKQSVAIYQWGRACFDLGVNKIEDVYLIYAEHTGKVLSERDKSYLKMGFFKELEQ